MVISKKLFCGLIILVLVLQLIGIGIVYYIISSKFENYATAEEVKLLENKLSNLQTNEESNTNKDDLSETDDTESNEGSNPDTDDINESIGYAPSVEISATGEESNSTQLKQCDNFYISWSGKDLVENTCVVVHSNDNNPGGYDLDQAFSEIYSPTKRQGFSVCNLTGDQSFAITCKGKDGNQYSDNVTLNFSKEYNF